MSDPQTLPRLLNAELDRLERGMEQQLQDAITHPLYGDQGRIQTYRQLIELQAMVSSRRAEVARTQGSQESPPDQALHRRTAVVVVDALIRYHVDRAESITFPYVFTEVDHRRATETLHLLRNHLDCCYEIRS